MRNRSKFLTYYSRFIMKLILSLVSVLKCFVLIMPQSIFSLLLTAFVLIGVLFIRLLVLTLLNKMGSLNGNTVMY